MTPRRLPLLAVALLAACQQKPSPASASNLAGATAIPSTNATPTSTSAPNATSAPNVVASPPPPRPLTVLEAVALAPGTSTPLLADAETLVEPGVTFSVDLGERLPDGRLALLDAVDAMLPAAGAREVGSRTRLTLQPASALPPGARLRLRVDGAATRELHAEDGGAREPREWVLRVAGEPRAEPRGPAGKKKRAR
jgi:hypothetical protein